MPAGRRGAAVLALFGTVVCWGSVPLFLKHFTSDFDAWTVNGIRYGFAAILLLPVCFTARGQPCINGISIWKAALVPAAVNTVAQVGWAAAPYYLDASVMGFGVTPAFLFALLGSLWLVPEERPLVKTLPFWLGTMLCAVGVSLLFLGAFSRRVSPMGAGIILATAVARGFYGVTGRRFMRGYPSHQSFSVVCLYTALVLAVLMALLGRPVPWQDIPARTFSLLFLSAAVGISLAHVLMFFCLKRIGPVMVSGAQFVTPFLTFAGAAVIFNETLAPAQWIGGCTVIAGSYTLLRAQARVLRSRGMRRQDATYRKRWIAPR